MDSPMCPNAHSPIWSHCEKQHSSHLWGGFSCQGRQCQSSVRCSADTTWGRGEMEAVGPKTQLLLITVAQIKLSCCRMVRTETSCGQSINRWLPDTSYQILPAINLSLVLLLPCSLKLVGRLSLLVLSVLPPVCFLSLFFLLGS